MRTQSQTEQTGITTLPHSENQQLSWHQSAAQRSSPDMQACQCQLCLLRVSLAKLHHEYSRSVVTCCHIAMMSSCHGIKVQLSAHQLTCKLVSVKCAS